MYLLLGCGDVGFSLMCKLKDQGAELTVVDKDPKKVQQLEDMGYNALWGDFTSPEILIKAGIERADVVLLMISNFRESERVLDALNDLKKQLNIDPVVVTRVRDEVEVDEAKRLGASDALPSSQILADFTLSMLQELETMTKEKRLRGLMRELSGPKMAIVLQTNPDPDSISSGVALKRYAKAFGVDSDIIYDGMIGHQNRPLVNLLGLNLLYAEDVDFERYGSFALVDVATHANCPLPQHILPTIVIDHHPVPSGEVRARFQDIEIVGSTSTLLTNYLRFGAVEIDGATAAALIIGILTDTMGLTRGAKPVDFSAMLHLMKFADADLLRKLQSPAISSEALDVLARAIKRSKVKGGYLVTSVGEARSREQIAQAADFMLNREGVMTALAHGICGNMVYVSARTNDVTLHLGQTLKEAFGKMGSAGGHARMAGAAIPLSAFGKIADKRALMTEINRTVWSRFLEAVGLLKPRVRRKRVRASVGHEIPARGPQG